MSKEIQQETLSMAKKGDLQSLRDLISQGIDLNVSVTGGDTTLLHLAAIGGNTEMARLLIDARADPESRNNAGNTPLNLAVLCGRQGMIELLVGAKAALDSQDNKGNTPLHTAIKGPMPKNRRAAMECLISNGAELNLQDNNGNTPLNLAILKNAQEATELLINKKADLNAHNKDGNTPLHNAAIAGQLEIVRLLLEKGVDIGVQNEQKQTPQQLVDQARIPEAQKHEMHELFNEALLARQTKVADATLLGNEITGVIGEFMGMDSTSSFASYNASVKNSVRSNSAAAALLEPADSQHNSLQEEQEVLDAAWRISRNARNEIIGVASEPVDNFQLKHSLQHDSSIGALPAARQGRPHSRS